MNENTTQPADRRQRRLIDTELDTCMMVEAAAGTGKTTKIIDRMTALLREGKCEVGRMAAITFTRKAAAEMRARFRMRLEEEVRCSSGQAEKRFRQASEDAARCYTGTIHSFCARLLRERPVEAAAPLDFRQIEEEDDQRLRLEAWDRFCARLYGSDSPLLDAMAVLGMEIADLRESFVRFADYPDVQRWPSEPAGPIPDTGGIRTELYRYIGHIQSDKVLSSVSDAGNDKLLDICLKLPFLARRTDWSDLASVERLMGVFEGDRPPATVLKQWPVADGEEKKRIIRAEVERYIDFRDKTARPFLRALQEHRYKPAVEIFSGAMAEYDAMRAEQRVLNFQDLLMGAARLLREGGAHIRNYFSRRFTHLLVDEFQDTDPLQAEVMMLLTADNREEKDWRRCVPRPGSLFIVGDPKQSIYRFRRADLVTYNRVSEIISRGAGRVVRLSANFRSAAPVLEWVNKAFEAHFPHRATDYSPVYVPLTAGKGRRPGSGSESRGTPAERTPDASDCMLKLVIPAGCTRKQEMLEYESAFIASVIDRMLKDKTVIRPPKEDGEGRAVRPSDFLIITWTKKNMSGYARALDRYGIPNAVAGGTVLNEVPQVQQLHAYMSALVHPGNPVALVAALRGGLFGLADTGLYEFKRCGGRFDWRSDVPHGIGESTRTLMVEAFEHFRGSRRITGELPPASAVRNICERLGLMVMAAASPGGNIQAGSVGKTIELLRSISAQCWSISQMVDCLGEIAASEQQHDGIPASALSQEPVRIMNLHKVKGLQAPLVFLADPHGDMEHPPEFHVDRSGGAEVRGFLKLERSTGPFGNRQTVAKPPGWDEKWAEKESRFAAAEKLRLLYVAATRAECRLFVTLRQKNKGRNPWAFFEESLAGSPALETDVADGVADADTGAKRGVRDENAFAVEAERIESLKQELLRPGYVRLRAKPDDMPGVYAAGRDFGAEWGGMIHLLLDARMRSPGADLRSLAASAVSAHEMPQSYIDKALETVDLLAGGGGGMLARARSSGRWLTEVPFCLRKEAGPEGPVLISGIIDLAFYEDDGWVIVDYKTEDAAADAAVRGALTEKYRPQIQNYADAWRACCGERVKEAGIFYTAAQRYVKVGF